jgi:hypothetical protein
MLENTEGVMQKDNPEKLATWGTQDTGERNVIEYRWGYVKEQSRETGNIGYTRHRTWIVLLHYPFGIL